MSTSVRRLYEQFQPENYQLEINIDPEGMTFGGRVSVRGKRVGRPSERFTFHQKGLKVTEVSIVKHDKKGDQQIEVVRINSQNSFDEVRLHTEDSLYPGDYTITMEWEAPITRPMNGVYPCFFKHDGKDKKLIATQFESHHAREAFPCVDEPEAKATFDLSLITPDSETVLANTPVTDQKEVDGGFKTRFDTTPKMSTYLLAFVYGELGYKEATTKDGVVIRTYATPDNVALTDHGLQVAVGALEFFGDYFATPYPLKKLDMVALPDFSSGAMENWGLVTYRETAMLADPVHTSIESKQMVALVITHELSHQWFGNLVTMKWWDDLWLNESFANMMEYRAVDALHPEWNIWEQFVSHEGVSAKRRDSLADVQPIHTDVNHPDEISTLFDPSIVYAKGGTVLYMLLNYIGEEAFRKGLQEYFKKHAYSNTQADDLWNVLSDASGQDIGEFMHKWLSSPGYPLVRASWNPGTDVMTLQQSRFLSDPDSSTDDLTPWHVPLAPTVEVDGAEFKTAQASVKVSKSDQPLLLNHDGTSYFLPHYAEAAHLQAIVNGIKRGEVTATDKFLLLDNYNLLQRGGVAATTDLLDLLTAFEDETSEMVWGAIAMSAAEARKLIEGDEKSEQKLDDFLGKLVASLAESLGWDDQPDDTAQTLRLRGLAISMAAGAKLQSVLDEGLARFRKAEKPSDLSPSTRSVAYFCAARYGNDEDFDKLMRLHETIQNADEKDELASGLTSAKSPERYNQLLDLLTSDKIRRQDLMHWFAWLLRNRYSREDAWQWLTTHWDWVVEQFSSDKSFGYFARFGGGVFTKQEELDRFKAFFEPKKNIVALSRDVTLATQEIQSRVSWRERNESAVRSWLEKL